MRKTRSLQLACSPLALACMAAIAPGHAFAAGSPATHASPDKEKSPAVRKTRARKAKAGKQKPVASKPVEASDDIVVTGTNISGVKPVGAEAIVVSRDDAEKTGNTTAADVLRTLPQVRVGEFDRDGGRSTISLQNSTGANSVTLRGLSSTSSTTLILVDGRRTVGVGANTSAVDANQVPLAALQRIEVVADGASAVYGSDAIGGVINYVLRKDYHGGEVSFRANDTGGGFEVGASATAGLNWKNLGGLGDGNILVVYDYAHRDPYRADKSPYLRSDLTGFGGPDLRINGATAMIGFIPSIVVTPDPSTNPPVNTTLPRALTSVYYGVPAGNGTGLTAGQLLLNQPALTDFSDYTDYLGRQDRHQVSVYLNQQLGTALELYVQGRYSNRTTTTRTTQSVSNTGATTVALRSMLRDADGNVTTTPNPYYIYNIPGVSQGSPGFPPFIPASPAADLTVLYPALKDFGARTYLGSDESFNVTSGVRAKLPGKWNADISYTLGRNKGCTYCMIGSYVNLEALQYQIDIGAINPLSSEPLSPAMLAKVAGTQEQIGHNGIDDILVKFDGPLFSLPGGTVRAAVGGERNGVFNWNENTSVTGTDNAPTVLTNRANSYYSRTITSAYGEIYVPLVSDDMNVPLIKKFVVSGAVRHDRYSDAGSATNPKFGFSWDVAKFLSLGGTWGTSFRGPSLTDKNPSAYVSGLITPYPVNFANQDPRISNLFCYGPGLCYTTAAIIFGSNPSVKPEKSTNWSLSAQFKPGGGFKAGLNYYNIHYRDRLVFPSTITYFTQGPDAGSSPPTYGGYQRYIIPIHNPSTCVNSDPKTADPALQPFLATPTYAAGAGVSQLGGLANFCSINVVLDSRFTNLSATTTDGLDINLNWDGHIHDLELSAAATANVIFNYKEQVSDDVAPQNRLGFIDTPVKWRGRANLSAGYRGATATIFANYTGSFVNDQARTNLNAIAPNQKVPSYTTFDLNLGYQTKFAGRSSPLKSLRYSFTIQNLFNAYPPLVYQSDRVIADVHGIPFGRTFAFQLTAGF